MELYANKAEVYASVGRLRQKTGVTLRSYPIDPHEILSRYPRIIIREKAFTTPGLRGVALVAGCREDPHIIFLELFRTKKEQKFDLSHELYHISFHGKFTSAFHCMDTDTGAVAQYPQLEWQANAGAAEYLMPYKLVIPFLSENIDCYPSLLGLRYLTAEVAKRFAVTLAAAELRVYELQYEVWQLYSGTDINAIVPLSRTQQRRAGKAVNLHQMKWLHNPRETDERLLSMTASLASPDWRAAPYWDMG